METRKNNVAGFATVVLLAAFMTIGVAMDAPPKVKRTALQRHDISAAGREALQVMIEFEPGASFGRHTHPGEEIIYVVEGTIRYQVDGRAPVSLSAGEVLFIPARTVHAAENTGTTNARELATYILRKGKPVVSPVK